MKLTVRIYKNFDTDLLALASTGYVLHSLFRDVIVSYANGTPLHLYFETYKDFDANDKHSFMVNVDIPDTETNAIYLIKHIKRRLRNSFCKALLRNAMIQQNVTSFFADQNLTQLQRIDAMSLHLGATPNLRSLEYYAKENIPTKVAQADSAVLPSSMSVPPTMSPGFTGLGIPVQPSIPLAQNISSAVSFAAPVQFSTQPAIRAIQTIQKASPEVETPVPQKNAVAASLSPVTEIKKETVDSVSAHTPPETLLPDDKPKTTNEDTAGDVTIKQAKNKALMDLFDSL